MHRWRAHGSSASTPTNGWCGSTSRSAFCYCCGRRSRRCGWATFGQPALTLIIVFTAGTILMRCAGCALNDWADRDFDAHVKRTADRPLARLDIEPWEALVVAAVLAAVAFLLVAYGTNLQTVRLSVVGVAISVAYPFTKRFLAIPQAFLGLAFSFGIPMVFTAVYGTLPLLALDLVHRQPVLGGRLRHRVRDGRPRRRHPTGPAHVRDHVRPLRRRRRRGLLWRLFRRHCLDRFHARHGAALLDRIHGGGGVCHLSSLAHSHPRTRSVLPRVPFQSLAGIRHVCRNRAGLCAPAERVAALH